jgi:hypothetical protein
MNRLDENKPYGLVFPAGTDGAYYEQDGRLFDKDKRLLGAESVEVAPVAASEPAPATEQEVPAAPEPEVIASVPGGDVEVDLQAWARGEVNYQFFKIKKAMADAGYETAAHRNAANAREAILNNPVEENLG